MATSESETDLISQLVKGLTDALKTGQSKGGERPMKLSKFHGKPSKLGDPTVREWLEEADVYIKQCKIPSDEQAQVVFNHLTGSAREEVKCHPESVRSNLAALKKLLRQHFGEVETVQGLQKTLYERNQQEDESLMDFSRALTRIHDRILEVATEAERGALVALRDRVLIRQFVAGVRAQSVRLELRRLELEKPEQTFNEMRDAARELFRDIEKVSKPKRSAANTVTAVARDEGFDPTEYTETSDLVDTSINSARANVDGQGLPEGIVLQLEQLSKQQGQIADLLQRLIARESPVAKSEARAQGRSQLRCFYCKRLGHVRADCWKRSADQQASGAPKANNSQTNPPAAGQGSAKAVNSQPPPL